MQGFFRRLVLGIVRRGVLRKCPWASTVMEAEKQEGT